MLMGEEGCIVCDSIGIPCLNPTANPHHTLKCMKLKFTTQSEPTQIVINASSRIAPQTLRIVVVGPIG